MQISKKDWSRYIKRLSAIDRKAADTMAFWMQENPDADVDELIWIAQNVAGRYGEAAGALACEMYDAVAAAQGVAVPPAEIADVPDYGETAKAVRGTMKNKQNTVPATVGRLVKRVGADTMLKNAERDHAQFAWIPMGDTCAFCMTLASRGWQYMSKDAMKHGHAEHIHANCDCQYAIRFDEESTVEGYDPKRYREMYDNAEGGTPQEKINSLRRAKYVQDKDRINAQRRTAYARRKGLSASNTSDKLPMASTMAADSWKRIEGISIRSSQPMQQGFSAFPPGDVLQENAKHVVPDGKYFDVALHGSQIGVGFGSKDTNMTAHDLAEFIRHQASYNGGPIRLLACNTGKRFGNWEYCFAEELSNAMGVEVIAPNDILFIYNNGKIRIGTFGNGAFETFTPNERRRLG